MRSLLIHLVLLLAAGLLVLAAALGIRAHEHLQGQGMAAAWDEALSRHVSTLAQLESQRPVSDYRAAPGALSPLAAMHPDKLVAAVCRLDHSGRLDSPQQSVGALQAQILRARGGPLPLTGHRALAWANEHQEALRALAAEPVDLSQQLPAPGLDLPAPAPSPAALADGMQAIVPHAATGCRASPFRLALLAGQALLLRRVEDGWGRSECHILLLDAKVLTKQAAAIVPAGLPFQTPADKRLLSVDIPPSVLRERSGSSRLWLLVGTATLVLLVATSIALAHSQGIRRRLADERAFTAAVSHELKTPVAALRALAENLRDGRVHDEQRRTRYYHSLHDEAARLGRLVDNVLDQARLQRDGLRLERRTGCLTAAIQAAVSRNQDLTISLDLDPSLDNIPVDGDAMARVIDNCLDNCRKYAAGSPIGIRAQGSTLEISDQGPGLKPDELRSIRKPWHRGSGHDHRPGLGLGLSLVISIIERHGGRVELAGKPGQGFRERLIFGRD